MNFYSGFVCTQNIGVLVWSGEIDGVLVVYFRLRSQVFSIGR
jgi:hypothetical protein